MKVYYGITYIFLLIHITVYAQKDKATSKLNLNFIPVFKGTPLILSNKEYITERNDTIKIEQFKMYISNITLQLNSEVVFKNPVTHLVDIEEAATLKLNVIEIPSSSCNGINFLIGVDSLTNVSGALDGDLDPIKGMYWAWNTGYISAKLEGTYKNNNSSKKFEFHIGGYQQPYTSSRTVSISFDEIKLQEWETLIVNCYVELAVWFSGNETLPLNKLNTIVHPCKASYEMANKYAEMIKYQSNYIHK